MESERERSSHAPVLGHSADARLLYLVGVLLMMLSFAACACVI